MLWANPLSRRLVLQDATDTLLLEAALTPRFPQAGQRVRLAGMTLLAQYGAVFHLGAAGLVVNNDGVHAMIEKVGDVYLEAGQNPFRLEWFNGLEGYGLELDISGPDISRQSVPSAWLSPTNPASSGAGLQVDFYQASDEVIPDFSGLKSTRAEFVPSVQLPDLPKPERTAAVFTGNLKIPRSGIYRFYLKSDDGSKLFVGKPTLQATLIGDAAWPTPSRLALGQILSRLEPGWIEVEGKVTLARITDQGLELELTAGAGRMRVEVGDIAGIDPDHLLNSRVRATGFGLSTATVDGQLVAGLLLLPGQAQLQFVHPPEIPTERSPVTNGMPLLSTAASIHALSRSEADRAYPVRLRGVVTCVLPERQAFTIQDATRGIYVVDCSIIRSAIPEIGDYLEASGTTDPSLFAPIVNATTVRSLGAGQLPEPVKPTWQQLISGSLDAQFVEIEGVVTAVQKNQLTLFTRGGVVGISVRLKGAPNRDLSVYENALVRIRGCLLAYWDYVTHEVAMGSVRLYAADIFVDEPAPADLFSGPGKTIEELLLFDPRAGAFQRVKVAGQVIHVRGDEFFIMNGSRGARVASKSALRPALGDLVEVVGFPDLFSGGGITLREAVVRKIGRGSLPKARPVDSAAMVRGEHDSTRVRVEGVLVGFRDFPHRQQLEMQSGVRSFVAELGEDAGTTPSIPIGSRLELTGTYAGLGGNRAQGQEPTSFELLLNSAGDIRILARPPWWTLKRMLFMVGALVSVLAAAALWITQLHRKVEERTRELGAQIQQRQRVEHQHAMEQERARIAQDLHDELGSGITEISMLAARARSSPDAARHSHLDQVLGKARDLVTALDEIVWAMNPRHDSLASLVSYFSLFADRFLGLAGINWRLEGPATLPDQPIGSQHRHQLFLVFKEALNNVVRHSGATEVVVNIAAGEGRLRLNVHDNGRGLDGKVETAATDGVQNMRSRVEKLGGRFLIESDPGHGTTLRCDVPTG